jgi:hypothetical protein
VISSPSSGQQQSVEKLCLRSCSATDGTGGPRIGKKMEETRRTIGCLSGSGSPRGSQPHARHVCVMDAHRVSKSSQGGREAVMVLVDCCQGSAASFYIIIYYCLRYVDGSVVDY